MLTRLEVWSCKALDSINVCLNIRLQKLFIENCSSLLSFGVGVLPITLNSIHISKCPKLVFSVSEEMEWCNNSLEHLTLDSRKLQKPQLEELIIWNSPEIESFPEGGLPSNLNLGLQESCGSPEKAFSGRRPAVPHSCMAQDQLSTKSQINQLPGLSTPDLSQTAANLQMPSTPILA
ncbi:hypothetical protein ACSBR1_017745 [Camellia fascicularis]